MFTGTDFVCLKQVLATAWRNFIFATICDKLTRFGIQNCDAVK